MIKPQNDLSFYIAIIDGVIDKKLRLKQGELMLAFRSGGLQGRVGWLESGRIKIYLCDLVAGTSTLIEPLDIIDHLHDLDIKRSKQKKREHNKQLEAKIQRLKSQLK